MRTRSTVKANSICVQIALPKIYLDEAGRAGEVRI